MPNWLNFRKQLVERMKLPKSDMLHLQYYTCSNVQFLFGFIFSLKLDFSIPSFQSKYWYMRKYEMFCESALCSDSHTFTSSLMYSTSICSYTMCDILAQANALYSDKNFQHQPQWLGRLCKHSPCFWLLIIKAQWNSDFSNPHFLEPPNDLRVNQKLFPLRSEALKFYPRFLQLSNFSNQFLFPLEVRKIKIPL